MSERKRPESIDDIEPFRYDVPSAELTEEQYDAVEHWFRLFFNESPPGVQIAFTKDTGNRFAVSVTELRSGISCDGYLPFDDVPILGVLSVVMHQVVAYVRDAAAALKRNPEASGAAAPVSLNDSPEVQLQKWLDKARKAGLDTGDLN